jgi:hypothetical protein
VRRAFRKSPHVRPKLPARSLIRGTLCLLTSVAFIVELSSWAQLCHEWPRETPWQAMPIAQKAGTDCRMAAEGIAVRGASQSLSLQHARLPNMGHANKALPTCCGTVTAPQTSTASKACHDPLPQGLLRNTLIAFKLSV